jgi:CHAT domain-containing protein
VVLADPDFDLGAAARLDRPPFPPLPGTTHEADAIAALLPGATRLVDADALLSRLDAVASPRVLHLATHGYAYSERTDAELAGVAEAVSVFRPGCEHCGGTGCAMCRSALPTRLSRLRRFPELRSGLALAGANTWIAEGDPGTGAGCGLLTVAAVGGLDLTATDLVVLSACDSGLGPLDDPAGHASLRAAFLRAGARTVVASLWRVNSVLTRRLMIRFYTLLLEGAGVAHALRTAQLQLRQSGRDVAAWGAFVCYGDPGPIGVAEEG